MRHLHQFETRVYKNLKHYREFLMKKFGADSVILYEEFNSIKISFNYARDIRKGYLERLYETFKDVDFLIDYSHHSVNFQVSNVSKEILEQFDLEMNVKKYNL